MKVYDIRHSVIIGKFYPFHGGHYFLVHSASVISEYVTVILLIDTKREFVFSFEERERFIVNGISKYSKYGCLKNVCVVPIFHDIQTNYDCEKTWDKFVEVIQRGIKLSKFNKKPSHLVVSDPIYGQKLSNLLNLTYVDLSDDREYIPVSGTQIRKTPFKYWDYINPDVRSFFSRRVVFLGAESTGTTTLTNDVYKYFEEQKGLLGQVEKICEYGREYIKNKVKILNSNIFDITISKEEIELFAEKQYECEENVAKISGASLILCDTDALASQVWCIRYHGKISSKIEEIIKKSAKREVYVLTSMEGIDLEYDGYRDGTDNIRLEMETRFEEELKNRGLRYIKVSGTRARRLEQVLEYLKGLLDN